MSSSNPGADLRLMLLLSLDRVLIPSAIICALVLSTHLAGS